MKTYSASEAQVEFPKVMKWIKSTPVAIQEKEENIAVILDYYDYVEMLEWHGNQLVERSEEIYDY